MKRTIKQTCAAIVAAINAQNYGLAKQLAGQLELAADELPMVETTSEAPPRTLPFTPRRKAIYPTEVH